MLFGDEFPRVLVFNVDEVLMESCLVGHGLFSDDGGESEDCKGVGEDDVIVEAFTCLISDFPRWADFIREVVELVECFI